MCPTPLAPRHGLPVESENRPQGKPTSGVSPAADAPQVHPNIATLLAFQQQFVDGGDAIVGTSGVGPNLALRPARHRSTETRSNNT